MTDRLHVGTRKGLFEIVRHNGTWDVADARFLGEPVTAVLADGDRLYAALDLGHFGTKLWRRDGSSEWRELQAPVFPPKPEDAGDDPHPWSLGKIWQIEPGGVDGRLWIGTMPGGLFRSDDGGDSWSLNEALWRMPERKQWMGVADIMQAEAMEAANAVLDKFVARMKHIANIKPDRVIREGNTSEEIAKLIDEDADIGILVLGAGTGKEGPGPLVSDIAKTAGTFPIPVAIVPGHLSDEDLEAMA